MERVDTLRLTIPVTGRYLIRVVNALLGDRAMLDSSTAQWLDQRGNGNGVLDVGDLRAYLRAAGVLPTRISKGQK
jgi:hypothetical protein